MKKVLFLCFGAILLLMPSISLTAQTQVSENYLITGPWTDYVAPMKYSIIVNDEGERIKDGPITISGKQKETYGNVDISGSYNLSASVKNGKMNGQMSVQAKYHGVVHYILGNEVEDHSYSFSGSFINGVPNGNFITKATNYGTSNVTYKKGILVGSYYVDEAFDDRFIKIKGSLNDKGQMIGTWSFDNLGSVYCWEFVNGVRVKESSSVEDSTPKQVEIAKKYAAGSIKEEELDNLGYVVVRDSIRLGDYANDLLYLHRIANWDKLGDCSFEDSYWVKYTYLYNLLPVTESLFETVLPGVKSDGYSEKIKFDEKLKAYSVEYYDSERRATKRRRLTEDQIATIKEAMDNYNRNHASASFIDFLKNEKEYHSFTSVDKLLNLTKQFNSLMSITDLSEAQEQYNKIIETLDEFKKAKWFQFDSIEKTADGMYYMMPSQRKDLAYKYLPVSSVEEYYRTFEPQEKEIRDYQKILPTMVANAVAAYKQALFDYVAKTLDRIVQESGYDKLLASYNEYIRYSSSYSSGDISLEVFLQSITPLVSYEIKEVEGGNPKAGYYSELLRVKVTFYREAEDGGKEAVPASFKFKEGKLVGGSLSLPNDVAARARERIRMQELRKQVELTLDYLIGKTKNDFDMPSKCSKFRLDGMKEIVRSDDLTVFKKAIDPFLPLLGYQFEDIREDNRLLHCTYVLKVAKSKKKQLLYRVHFDATRLIYINTLDYKKAELIGEETL